MSSFGGVSPYPDSDLHNLDGTLYGTTVRGGALSLGTVFKITTSGAYKLLQSFAGNPDGAYPMAGLIDVKGTLYGTTAIGGTGGGQHIKGWGTVFALTP